MISSNDVPTKCMKSVKEYLFDMPASVSWWSKTPEEAQFSIYQYVRTLSSPWSQTWLLDWGLIHQASKIGKVVQAKVVDSFFCFRLLITPNFQKCFQDWFNSFFELKFPQNCNLHVVHKCFKRTLVLEQDPVFKWLILFLSSATRKSKDSKGRFQ